MKGIWENSEVRELFDLVENYKDKNKSLRQAFLIHAQKYGRKPNSVRNYYYHEVDNLKEDKGRLENLGIDLARHNKTSIIYFSKQEEEKLMKEIDNMAKQGISVRKACLSLSGGDVGQMLRYQNKYRNFLTKQKAQEKCVKNEIIESNDDKGKVITFKKVQKRLTENEVQSLFMGLVRLVKRNAREESEEVYKQQISLANDKLRQAIKELYTKEQENLRLKEEFLKIKEENAKLIDERLKNRCEVAENLKNKT
jgi:hypothetical protein